MNTKWKLMNQHLHQASGECYLQHNKQLFNELQLHLFNGFEVRNRMEIDYSFNLPLISLNFEGGANGFDVQSERKTFHGNVVKGLMRKSVRNGIKPSLCNIHHRAHFMLIPTLAV